MKKALTIILIVLIVAGFGYLGWRLYELNTYAGNLEMTLSYVQGELTDQFSWLYRTLYQIIGI